MQRDKQVALHVHGRGVSKEVTQGTNSPRAARPWLGLRFQFPACFFSIRVPAFSPPPTDSSGHPTRMSGFEVAGIVLGSIPIIVTAIEAYINFMRDWGKVATELKSLNRQLTTERAKLYNVLDQLLGD